MVLLFTCPAVSQICNLTFLPSIATVLILKSILHNATSDPGGGGAVLPHSRQADGAKQKGKPRAVEAGRRNPSAHPMVVMKLFVNWSSANRNRRQLLPTPWHVCKQMMYRVSGVKGRNLCTLNNP